jgi:hypothetical protein
MFSLFGLSIIRHGSFINMASKIATLVSLVAVAVRAIKGTPGKRDLSS